MRYMEVIAVCSEIHKNISIHYVERTWNFWMLHQMVHKIPNKR